MRLNLGDSLSNICWSPLEIWHSILKTTWHKFRTTGLDNQSRRLKAPTVQVHKPQRLKQPTNNQFLVESFLVNSVSFNLQHYFTTRSNKSMVLKTGYILKRYYLEHKCRTIWHNINKLDNVIVTKCSKQLFMKTRWLFYYVLMHKDGLHSHQNIEKHKHCSKNMFWEYSFLAHTQNMVKIKYIETFQCTSKPR